MAFIVNGEEAGLVIEDPRSGQRFNWECLSAEDAQLVQSAGQIVESAYSAHRDEADRYFTEMKRFRMLGAHWAGKTLGQLLGAGVKVYLFADAKEGQVASTVLSLYQDTLAISRWALQNLSARDLAGTLVHECAHLNGVMVLHDFGPHHQWAWYAPKILGLPTNHPLGDQSVGPPPGW